MPLDFCGRAVASPLNYKVNNPPLQGRVQPRRPLGQQNPNQEEHRTTSSLLPISVALTTNCTCATPTLNTDNTDRNSDSSADNSDIDTRNTPVDRMCILVPSLWVFPRWV